jgi:hypothetical protein
MKPEEVARHLRRVVQASDPYRPDFPGTIEGIGDAYVTLDADNDSPYPSSNLNAVYFMGCTKEVVSADIDRIMALFHESGCQRFFFWLSPGPQKDEIRSWLAAYGLNRFGGTVYPTLLRAASPVKPHETSLEVKRLDPEEVETQSEALTEVLSSWGDFMRTTCNQPQFDHYGAYANNRLVAAAGLYVSGDFGYLGWAGTAEPFRGLGGQNALITARINRAVERGCRWVCSETLYMLENSLRNLERNGFHIIYDKEVYIWERP